MNSIRKYHSKSSIIEIDLIENQLAIIFSRNIINYIKSIIYIYINY